jgi:hypothetical protein
VAAPALIAYAGSHPETNLFIDCWEAEVRSGLKLDLKFLAGGDLEVRRLTSGNPATPIKGRWNMVAPGSPGTVSVTMQSYSATYTLDTASMRLILVSGEGLPPVLVHRQAEKGLFSP